MNIKTKRKNQDYTNPIRKPVEKGRAWWQDKMEQLEQENARLRALVGESDTETFEEVPAFLLFQARVFAQRLGNVRGSQVFRSIRDKHGNLWTCGEKSDYTDEKGVYHPAVIRIVKEPQVMKFDAYRAEHGRLIQKASALERRLRALKSSIELNTLSDEDKESVKQAVDELKQMQNRIAFIEKEQAARKEEVWEFPLKERLFANIVKDSHGNHQE